MQNNLKIKIKFKYSKTIKNALQEIKQNLKTNKNRKIILFSPAAASFDQFKNFEERGKYFNKIIKKINFKNKV